MHLFPSLAQSVSTFDSHIQTITNAVGILTTKVAEIEQNISAIAARIFALEAGNGSASGVSGSPAGSWPLPQEVGGSTVTGSRDPGSMDENRNMRRKLETSLDDENSCGAVFSRFPCAQNRPFVFA